MSYPILLRGPLASGKTTLAKKLASLLDAHYFGMDEILEQHGLDQIPPDAPCIPAGNFIQANELILPEAQKLLASGQTVIFDACFYHREVIDHLVKNLPFKHYIFTLKAPLELCIRRDNQRAKSYGPAAAKAVHSLVSAFNYGINIDATGSLDDTLKIILSHLPQQKQ
ncbi:MAG TPA: ATP-binding protein [Patescibacteria group bacterium]|nr:ATP-binding protein [Patescibacteria group bacterium]